jgi:hypothetical protein
MPEIDVRAVRWISDDPQPGIVECRLLDADGVEHVLVDKAAIFDADDRLRSDAEYPIDLKLECSVVRTGEADLVVELAHSIESVEGQRMFRVPKASVS